MTKCKCQKCDYEFDTKNEIKKIECPNCHTGNIWIQFLDEQNLTEEKR